MGALTRWLEREGIPQGEAPQIAEGWIKVHIVDTTETIILELTLKEIQNTLSMPIGYERLKAFPETNSNRYILKVIRVRFS
jgi:hypothetical protein